MGKLAFVCVFANTSIMKGTAEFSFVTTRVVFAVLSLLSVLSQLPITIITAVVGNIVRTTTTSTAGAVRSSFTVWGSVSSIVASL